MWFAHHRYNNNIGVDQSRAVFIDESSFNLHLRRSHGRSKKGTRANVVIPTERRRAISLLASMSMTGMQYCKTITNSTVNASIFTDYLLELCTFLRDEKQMINACLILDNARIHKRDEIERITSQFNFEFKFLAPYSYMLNPIESAFSKIKNGIRSKLRTHAVGTLSEMIMEEKNNVTTEDSAGYFRLTMRNIINCAAGIPYKHQ